MPQWVELLASWRCQYDSPHMLEARRMAPLCVMWCIWRERNSQYIEEYVRTVIELKECIFKTLYG
jgi:hypothetical protein